tara:strand:+ start:103 stop:450 length:348 start_codon:yes stop_codon:yes gene_type:complete
MSYTENFMFFNEGTDAADATGDGQMFKSSSFLGANVTGAAEVTLHFASRNGAATDDTVAVTMSSSDVKLLMQELTAVLSNPKGGFFVQSDFVGNNAPKPDGFLSGVSGIVITTQA